MHRMSQTYGHPGRMFAKSRMIRPKGAIPLLARGGKCSTHERISVKKKSAYPMSFLLP